MNKKIEYEEIKQTPKESAITTYKVIVADLQEGLNYGVSKERYNEDMKAIGSSKNVETDINAEIYCTDFYEEYTKLSKKEK